MRKLLWIVHTDEGLSLGFGRMEDATAFLQAQSPNAEWLSGWTLAWINSGTTVEARHEGRVVLHFDEN